MRRKLKDKNIRKVFKQGASYALTLPMEIVKKLKIKDGQKVEVKEKNRKIIIEDWEK